jgi:hypothetical protein
MAPRVAHGPPNDSMEGGGRRRGRSHALDAGSEEHASWASVKRLEQDETCAGRWS